MSEGDLDAEDASDDAAPDPVDEGGTASSSTGEPDVEADVDPYDSPLTESIGDAVDADALAEVVERSSDDADPRS